MLGADDKLVEITLAVDRYEPDQRARLLDDHDGRIRNQFVPPALAPPGDARGEVDGGISLLPGAAPQFDGGIFVVGAIGAKAKIAHPTVPSASARCGGCACRLLRSARRRAAGIRQS